MTARNLALIAVLVAAIGESNGQEPPASPTPANTGEGQKVEQSTADSTKSATDEDDARTLAAERAKAEEMRDRWKRETNPERRREIGDELAELAAKMSNWEEDTDSSTSKAVQIVVEVATDGEYEHKQIAVPKQSQPVALKVIRTFDADPEHPWVVRRMTKDRIEVWLPRHGWLFDGKGRLIAEARPPRRDGTGREWYGAFLPDGRWVTTDLFEQDKTLTFFTRSGKWLKEIKADALVPAVETEEEPGLSTIGWCRSTRDGEAYVVSVGQNGGRGVALVKWSGEHQVLGEQQNVWALCYPRDVEPKGMYTILSTLSDDGGVPMTREEHGHGPLVGFPAYEAGNVHARIPEGETFGFWPGSNNVYMVTSQTRWTRDEKGEMHEHPRTYQTWFYNADGQFAGWIAARRIADAATGNGMLFVDGEEHVIGIGPDYGVQNVQTFAAKESAASEPVKLFPDLRLGCFARDGKLLLASW